MTTLEEVRDTQEQWNNIQRACLEAGKETLGMRKYKEKSHNEEVAKIAEKRMKLREDINANKSKTQRLELQKERNKLGKEIKSD